MILFERMLRALREEDGARKKKTRDLRVLLAEYGIEP